MRGVKSGGGGGDELFNKKKASHGATITAKGQGWDQVKKT